MTRAMFVAVVLMAGSIEAQGGGAQGADSAAQIEPREIARAALDAVARLDSVPRRVASDLGCEGSLVQALVEVDALKGRLAASHDRIAALESAAVAPLP